MICGRVQFVTDFADQALVLPAILLITLSLALIGWWRGLAAWLAVIGVCYAIVLAMKLLFIACGSPLPMLALRSPSGHTMAGTLLYGGVLALFGLARRPAILCAVGLAMLIGITRLALHDHTVSETLLGAAIGVAGVAALTRLPGPPPTRLARLSLPLRLALALLVVAPALLLHADRSPAEQIIAVFARTHLRQYLACREG